MLHGTQHLGLTRMSTVITQQQQSPPITSAAAYSAHGSFVPVIGVVAVVLILCAAAVAIGRLCSGRSIMGYGHYDMESWVEAKFSSCVDGRILALHPPVTSSGSGGGEGGSAPASAAEAGSSTAEQQSGHENVGS